ncbi:hypothetical protein CR513_29504, partial [Mucuna pruriens]
MTLKSTNNNLYATIKWLCKRKNRTILNMVRSLLVMNSLSKSFLPKAINWSLHILNRRSTLAIQNMTLEEAWSDCQLAINHFRIFECLAYACLSDHCKAYKLYNPHSKKIVISRDVISDEDKFWNWSEDDTQQNIPIDLKDGEQPYYKIIRPHN